MIPASTPNRMLPLCSLAEPYTPTASEWRRLLLRPKHERHEPYCDVPTAWAAQLNRTPQQPRSGAGCSSDPNMSHMNGTAVFSLQGQPAGIGRGIGIGIALQA